jgi:outer membrane protein TolC
MAEKALEQAIMAAGKQEGEQLAGEAKEAGEAAQESANVDPGAAAAARQAEQLSLNQYRAGTVDFTTVIQTQTTALSAEQTLLNIRLNRLAASATLVTALGGGWRDVDLPPPVPVPGIETGKELKKKSWWPF